jgi:hypothetical protein
MSLRTKVKKEDANSHNLPIAHLFRFERSNDSIPPRPP